ncbi:hypothetical protein [Haloferax sp. DFSO60]|uniref:hypothetical protein n=1 Tax=Haloferax sp. DFSO60 TaxID=3388652 RepID=UPI003979B081
MSPERAFWVSQAGFFIGYPFLIFSGELGEFAVWKLILMVAMGIYGLLCVRYAIQERYEGVPESFREWRRLQQIGVVSASFVFVLGIGVAAFRLFG